VKLSLTSIKQHAETRALGHETAVSQCKQGKHSSRSSPTAVNARAQPPKRTRSFSTTSPIDRELLRTAHPPSRQGRYLSDFLSSLIPDFAFSPHLLSLRLSHSALSFRLVHNLHRISDTHHVSPTSVRANREFEGPWCP
jgi:hypothetical protein